MREAAREVKLELSKSQFNDQTRTDSRRGS